MIIRQTVALLIFASLLSACGGSALSKARHTLELSAEAVQTVDDQTAPHHARANDRAEAAAQGGASEEEFLAIVTPWRTLTAAIEVARQTLTTAEAAVDTWENGGENDDWLAAAPCVLVALREILEALDAVDVALPGPLALIADAVSYAADLTEATCVEALSP